MWTRSWNSSPCTLPLLTLWHSERIPNKLYRAHVCVKTGSTLSQNHWLWHSSWLQQPAQSWSQIPYNWSNLYFPLLHHLHHLTRNPPHSLQCKQYFDLLTRTFYLSTTENNTRCLHDYAKKSFINNTNNKNNNIIFVYDVCKVFVLIEAASVIDDELSPCVITKPSIHRNWTTKIALVENIAQWSWNW